MTVGAIGNNAALDSPQTADPSAWQTRMQQSLGSVAQLFGESAQQLSTQLQSGQTSLSALAQSKGISQSDLLGAIQQGLAQSSSNGGPALTSSQMTNISSNIANRVHGHHHHHGGAGGAGSSSDASALSALLDPNPLDDTSDPTTTALAALGVTNPDSTSDSSLGSSSTTSPLQTDTERILFQLQSAASTTGTTGAANTWTNSTAPDLLAQFAQFDQTA